MSWTTHADLAEGAAAILTDSDRPTSETPVLTAADAVDLDDVARILSDLAGRSVRRVVVEDEDHVAGLTGHGVPEPAARMSLTLFQARPARGVRGDRPDPGDADRP